MDGEQTYIHLDVEQTAIMALIQTAVELVSVSHPENKEHRQLALKLLVQLQSIITQ